MVAQRKNLVLGATPVRLTAGGHSSPREGVCVVELASLIAHEEFSDRPRCVCPVIGAFLRGLNDRAPYAERQRLGPYAERIVGSRGGSDVTRKRREICLRWAGEKAGRRGTRGLWSWTGTRLRMAIFCGPGAAVRPNEGAGDYAARVAMARGDVEGAFELLETLLAAGREGRLDLQPFRIAASGQGHLNGNGHRASNGSRPTSNGHHPRVGDSQSDRSKTLISPTD